MRLAVTGAGGFIGRALAARLANAGLAGSTTLIDRVSLDIPGFACRQLDLAADPASLSLFADIDVVCHLAALPGAAAEADPVLSRKVNVDLPLALIERMSGREQAKRLILASSIAVYGSSFGTSVDDETPARPDSVYGTHKRMVELALSDAIRRGAISGGALRVPGVVARPRSASGFGSAFLSDIFHAVLAGAPYAIPVARDATSWIVSSIAIADHLAHAMLGTFDSPDALLLPATHVSMQDLVAAVAEHGDASRIRFVPDPAIQARFGAYPTIMARRAHNLGFVQAESLAGLVRAVSTTTAIARQVRISGADAR